MLNKRRMSAEMIKKKGAWYTWIEKNKQNEGDNYDYRRGDKNQK